MSKIKAEPMDPITGTGSGNQTPVINGSPEIKTGDKPLINDSVKPNGIKKPG